MQSSQSWNVSSLKGGKVGLLKGQILVQKFILKRKVDYIYGQNEAVSSKFTVKIAFVDNYFVFLSILVCNYILCVFSYLLFLFSE